MRVWKGEWGMPPERADFGRWATRTVGPYEPSELVERPASSDDWYSISYERGPFRQSPPELDRFSDGGRSAAAEDDDGEDEREWGDDRIEAIDADRMWAACCEGGLTILYWRITFVDEPEPTRRW
jgi:hypothetical protein